MQQHTTTSLHHLIFVTIACFLSLTAGSALGQDATEDLFIIESGVLAFELDPNLPSYLEFEIEELENHLCGTTKLTTPSTKQGTTDLPTPTVHLGLGPMTVCTEISEPDRLIPPFEEGQGVLISIDNSTTLAKNGRGTVDLRPDILRFASPTPVDLSCGDWTLEVDLFGDQSPSPAEVLNQGDRLGGLITTHLQVELELRFTDLLSGNTVSLLRDHTFTGAASWSSTAIDLGLADAAFTVSRADSDPTGSSVCIAVVEVSAAPFSVGWTAKTQPEPQSFCLNDWNEQGQLCLRPRVKDKS